MGDNTGIQWTEATWNPIVGCSILSAGCRGCYAMGEAARLERMGVAKYAGLTTATKTGPVWTGEVRLAEDALDQPLRWRRPRTIFVNSMSDLFHERLPEAQIDRVFAVMALSPQHIFQVLTKRSALMREYMSDRDTPLRIAEAALRVGRNLPDGHPGWRAERWRRSSGAVAPVWPLPNLWVGVSVEDQDSADARIADLLAVPAALRFISAEPLLGPVDIRWALSRNPMEISAGFLQRGHFSPGMETLRHLDWVIVGGESGPRARSCSVEWIYDLVRQCRGAGVATFVKQLGACFFDEKDFIGGAAVRVPRDAGRDLSRRLKHRKGGDPAEWPECLRVQQMPTGITKAAAK